VTISVVRDDVTTKENARTLPTIASIVVKNSTSPENTSTSVEKILDSYRSGTRRKHSCHVSKS